MKLMTAWIAGALSLPVSLFVTFMVYRMAQDTGNNGEFFDVVTGAPTGDLFLLLALSFIVATVVLAIPCFLAALAIGRQRGNGPSRAKASS